jgi:hypothetical protein
MYHDEESVKANSLYDVMVCTRPLIHFYGKYHVKTLIFLFLFFVLRIEYRTSHMLGKHSIT